MDTDVVSGGRAAERTRATSPRQAFDLLCGKVFIHFRRRRMRRFFELFRPSSAIRLIDIGGTAQTWHTESAEHEPFRVVLLNHLRYDDVVGDRFQAVVGDATRLPFPDHAFDIAFSNSVIEHMETWERQQAFAREARRVAKKLWIQTPAKSFPLECHLLAPWIQYLPKKIQHRIVWLTPRRWLTPDAVHPIVDEVRLLTFREFAALFPDCQILRERVCGITKSYIAVRI